MTDNRKISQSDLYKKEKKDKKGKKYHDQTGRLDPTAEMHEIINRIIKANDIETRDENVKDLASAINRFDPKGSMGMKEFAEKMLSNSPRLQQEEVDQIMQDLENERSSLTSQSKP